MTGTQPARGMRDFLPDDVRRRQYVIGVVAEVYERYGFEPLETPAVENIETLLGKYGAEGDKLIFKILRRGEAGAAGETDLALRYDLTVPLARVVAEYRGRLPRLFKRYQVQPVWRADRPQKGRYREFYQCDADIVGSRSMVVEAELLAAASDVLERLGFRDFVVRLNHRQVLGGLLETSGVPAGLHEMALVAIDKLDKIGPSGVERELVDGGLDRGAAGRVLDLLQGTLAGGSLEEALTRLGQALRDHEEGRRAVEELGEIVSLGRATGLVDRLRLDPALARGLSYYTGPIFEVVVPDLAGSVAGGGRYDRLIGLFLGEEVPACGISLGLERLLVVMAERGMFPPGVDAPAADALLTVWRRETLGETLALATELRRAGLSVEVYPEPDRLGKQFKYAAARGLPFVAVVGDEERAQGVVAIKDLATGVQQSVPRDRVAAYLLERRRPRARSGGT
jgi:histidyl-tRNA synthetase